MDSTKRMMTTVRGKALMELHIVRKSQLEPVADWRKRAAYTYKVATIRLLLDFTRFRLCRNQLDCFNEQRTQTSAPFPRPARRTALLVKSKNHVDGGFDFNRFSVKSSRLIAPLADRFKSCGLQKGRTRNNVQRLNAAVLRDNCVQANGT